MELTVSSHDGCAEQFVEYDQPDDLNDDEYDRARLYQGA